MAQEPNLKSKYSVRSMKTDLESGKKGAPPQNIPINLESGPKKDPSDLGVVRKNPAPIVRTPSPKPVLPPIPSHQEKPDSLRPIMPLEPLPPVVQKPVIKNIEPPYRPLAPIPAIPRNPEPKREEPKPYIRPTEPTRTFAHPKTAGTLPQPKAKMPKLVPPKKTAPRRIIILGVVAVIILIFIIGEIWWFFIRPNPEPIAPSVIDSFPAPEEIAPATEDPEVSESTTSTNIPSPLLFYAKTEEVNLSSLSAEELGAQISSLVNQSNNENSLVRIVFLSSLESGAEVLDLDSFISLSGIVVPESIKNNLDGTYDLFFLSQNPFDATTCLSAGLTSDCHGPRLGLVFGTDGTDISPSLRSWETNMARNMLSILPSGVNIPSGSFKDASYQGTSIRYKNFPIDTTTIDYAVSASTLLITTSKTSMHAAIDALR